MKEEKREPSVSDYRRWQESDDGDACRTLETLAAKEKVVTAANPYSWNALPENPYRPSAARRGRPAPYEYDLDI